MVQMFNLSSVCSEAPSLLEMIDPTCMYCFILFNFLKILSRKIFISDRFHLISYIERSD